MFDLNLRRKSFQDSEPPNREHCIQLLDSRYHSTGISLPSFNNSFAIQNFCQIFSDETSCTPISLSRVSVSVPQCVEESYLCEMLQIYSDIHYLSVSINRHSNLVELYFQSVPPLFGSDDSLPVMDQSWIHDRPNKMLGLLIYLPVYCFFYFILRKTHV